VRPTSKKCIKIAAIALPLMASAAVWASTPPPDAKIAVAKASVQRAEQAGAPQLAPLEMATARDKLQRAEKAAADRDFEPATRLAEQADIDAQLAEATALTDKSHKAAMELAASMQALQQEASRADQPPPLPAAPPQAPAQYAPQQPPTQ